MATKQVKIISIGAAVQDVTLRGKIFEPHREKGELVEEFELGAKNEVEAITHSTGGGATNASVTFARQGLTSLFMGKVGNDVAGKIVLEALRADNVNTSLVTTHKKLGTGYSTILLAPTGERTVLTYRGASSDYELSETDFFNTTSDWIYISSLSGDVKALKTIVAFAKKHDIKIAVNPGHGELSEKVAFSELLPAFSILSMNREEMEMLFRGKTPEDLLARATMHVPLVLLTDGPKGSYACDGTSTYKAGVYEDVPVIDRLGAGDAFTSGFVASIAQEKSIQDALTVASANSTSVVGKIGAKAGILTASEVSRLHPMDIKVTALALPTR